MSSQNTSDVHVFAYGSNMCVPRMLARVPGARPIMSGFVRQRRFVFHKLSTDGSAKADAAFSVSPEDRVWGIVFRMRKEEKPVLDGHEFLGIGYDESRELVTLQNGKQMRAWLYVARSEAIVKDVKPYSWYKAFVLHGARQHRLPDAYVRYLEQLECMPDPNSQRHATNQRLISH